MTYSILASDQKTGTFGAAAATGSLCVGGWVIRGSLEAGLVASQGTSPSTLWRDQTLEVMRQTNAAKNAVNSITLADPGRAHRQLIALDRSGATQGFTGTECVTWAGHVSRPNLIVAGNMLAGAQVLDDLLHAYSINTVPMADRLLAGLLTAESSGGDSRGLRSAALLVLAPDRPPLDLRIDHHETPLKALSELLEHARTRPYVDWLDEVPVATDPTRAPKTLATP